MVGKPRRNLKAHAQYCIRALAKNEVFVMHGGVDDRPLPTPIPSTLTLSNHTSSHSQVMPNDGEQEDPQELPIPEQFISSFQGGKLLTSAASHSGA